MKPEEIRPGGNCPVQAFGERDGLHYYVRSRGSGFTVGYGKTDDDAVSATEGQVWIAVPTDLSMGWIPDELFQEVAVLCDEAYQKIIDWLHKDYPQDYEEKK